MPITVKFTAPQDPKEGALALGVFIDNKLSPAAKEWDGRTNKALSRALKSTRFKGKVGETMCIPSPEGTSLSEIILVGLGEKPSEVELHKAGAAVVKAMGKSQSNNVAIHFDGLPNPGEAQAASFIGAGAMIKAWRFDKYFTKKEKDDYPALDLVTIYTNQTDQAEKEFQSHKAVVEGAYLTRDLVTEPPNVLYPEAYAKIASSLKDFGIKVEILDEKDMAKLGMGALLGVGQGSHHKPRMVIMQWHGAENKNEAPVAFVGKGVTFDSGGISIKPGTGMEEMKWDMAGSAVVVGLMKALATRKARVNAVGVIGLVENMPSGAAQRPSDVVKTMSGQTVEVLNTDAEGRLVLCDALYYTQDRFKPKFMIDLATLTMNVIYALGYEIAGLFSNNEELIKQIEEAGKNTSEKVWNMPMDDFFLEEMKSSHIADLQNIGTTRGASSTTAAKFMEQFVNDVPWAHLDIAGTSWANKDWALCDKGATAFGVRLLDRLVRDNYEGK